MSLQPNNNEEVKKGIPILRDLKKHTQHPDLNWFQQLFSGLQLPDSKGKPSMHVTTLWYAGIFPVLATVCAEIWRVARRPEAEFATGFWALISTLVTVVIAANGVREYQIRKAGGAAPTIEPGSGATHVVSNPPTEEEPAPTKKYYGKYGKKKAAEAAKAAAAAGGKQLVLPKQKGRGDFGPT